ncbi:MAG TPA: VTT domain-containing protein [Candidatus Binatia bacterium]|nr:VTT domain-containing protein [Candidatus Binatia bacterium]
MRRHLRPLILLAALATALVLADRFELGRYGTVDGLRALATSWSPHEPVAFMALCVAGIFLTVPPLVLIALGGVVLGAPAAFVYGWIACVAATTGTFVAARYFLRRQVQELVVRRFPRLVTLDERLARRGFRTVLILRLVLVLAPLLNWGLGTTRVRLGDYVAGTALGVVPGMAITLLLADGIANRPAGTALLSSPRMIVGLVAVLLVVSAALASRRLLGRNAPPAA